MQVTVNFDGGGSMVFQDGTDLKALRKQRADLTQEEIGARLRLPQPWVSQFERKITAYFGLIEEKLRERGAADE
jgi:hypothetical protein